MSDGKVTSTQDQTNMSTVDIQKYNLRSYSACIKCPKCSAVGYTRSEQKCNVASLVTAYCCGGCWTCFHLWKKLDLTCWDATHKCAECGEHIADYKSC